MPCTCPRCDRRNPDEALYCASCGLPQRAWDGGPPVAGRVRHPEPRAAPDGFQRVGDALDLYYRVGSAWGGRRLLDTENIGIAVFNAGFALENAVLAVRGENAAGRAVFDVELTAAALPRGAETLVEVPSYEISEPPVQVRAALVAADFAAEE